MSEPIVFISTHRIKESRLDEFKLYLQQGSRVIEASKPRTVAFLAYLDEDGTTVRIVHIFPDPEAMELHMEGVGERAKGAYEFLEPVGFAIYGKPDDRVMQMMMQQSAGSGAILEVMPQHVAGYIRLDAAHGSD
jgi:hypothetical protein